MSVVYAITTPFKACILARKRTFLDLFACEVLAALGRARHDIGEADLELDQPKVVLGAQRLGYQSGQIGALPCHTDDTPRRVKPITTAAQIQYSAQYEYTTQTHVGADSMQGKDFIFVYKSSLVTSDTGIVCPC